MRIVPEFESAFVTGATGFLGGALLDSITRGPVAVRALARDRTGGETIAATGAKPVIGHLFEPEVLDEGMAGVDVVFHVAGINETCASDPEAMFRVNVDGTRAVIEAAARNRVRRVVCTSSAAAIGEDAGAVASEATKHNGVYLSHYAHSKHLGEVAAFELGDSLGVEVVAVNPSSVQGPGRTTGTARILLAAINHRLPLIVDATFSVVDISDTATAHVLAADRGASGERYLVSGATLTTHDALRQLSVVTGLDHRAVVLPRGALAAITPVARLAQMRGSTTLCPELIRTLHHGHRIDGERIVRELGMVYTDWTDTLVRTVQWYVAYGFVRRPLPNFPTLR